MQIIRFLIVAAALATLPMEARGEMLGQVSSESQFHQLQESFLGAILRSSPAFNEQYGAPAPGGGMMGFGASMATGSSGGTAIRVIPSITLSETYDGNVFYAPKIPGLKREDYVTTAAPQLQVQRLGSLVGLNFGIGASASHYAVNQGLSYVGFNTSTILDVTQLARHWVPGLKNLQVTESFSYSPMPPSFLSGDANISQALSPDLSSISDQYVRGLQAFRVNTYTNMTGVSGVVPVSSSVDFRGAYTYSFIKFGTPFVPGSSGDFFPSTNHLATVGPTIQISAKDSINLNAMYQRTDYAQESYSAPGASLGWNRQWNPQFRSSILGGLQYAQVESSGGGVTATQSDLAYTSQVSLVYTSGPTIASLNYSAGVYPSYFVEAGPLLSNMVTLTVWHRLSSQLSFSASVNYSKNDPLKGQPVGTDLSFESISSSIGFSYLLNRNMALSLSESFGYFKGAGPGAFGSSGGSGIGDEFTRNAVTISLTAFGLY